MCTNPKIQHSQYPELRLATPCAAADMHCNACSNPELKSSVEELKQKTENLVER